MTYSYLACGAIIQGIGMALFLFPNTIPSGGAAGLAILLNYWLSLSIGFSLWFVNFIALIVAFRYFGYTWTLRTMFSVTITSVTVSLCTAFWHIPHINLGVEIFLGALLYGIGVGILIRYRASSGGLVVLALIIAAYNSWSPGKAMFWVNMSVFVLNALVIDIKIVAYATICQMLSTRVIDFVDRLKIPHSSFPAMAWRKK
ncbi:YitT family protein [Bacillus sp. T33-2]|uniref:YitT family protein n=1 Tax=Bacillus sp. T33-2 TaxID=2054168 RepID=UPI0021551972|nr:YitT family protein [Bacillus sp. T33-2]